MKKHMMIGQVRDGKVFVTVKFTDGRLSISGVVGPTSDGDSRGSAGQINMGLTVDDFKSFGKGFNRAQVQELFNVWEKYHLNDMQAGSPAQTAYLEKIKSEQHEIQSGPFSDHFEWACYRLRKKGLNPDPSFIHNGKPYKYGSAWLKIGCPDQVISFLKGLPESGDLPTVWQ